MKNKSRTRRARRKRRQQKQGMREPRAKPRHGLTAGRTGGVHCKKTPSKKKK